MSDEEYGRERRRWAHHFFDAVAVDGPSSYAQAGGIGSKWWRIQLPLRPSVAYGVGEHVETETFRLFAVPPFLLYRYLYECDVHAYPLPGALWGNALTLRKKLIDYFGMLYHERRVYWAVDWSDCTIRLELCDADLVCAISAYETATAIGSVVAKRTGFYVRSS